MCKHVEELKILLPSNISLDTFVDMINCALGSSDMQYYIDADFDTVEQESIFKNIKISDYLLETVLDNNGAMVEFVNKNETEHMKEKALKNTLYDAEGHRY